MEWKRELEIKKERNIEEMFCNDARPKINHQSEIILNLRNPDYLEKKVEERLQYNYNKYVN